MADNKVPPEDRKRSYLSPLIIAVIAVAIGGVAFFRAPEPAPPSTKIEPPAPIASAPPPKPAPIAQPVLARDDLIREASLAASQFAASGMQAANSATLIGKRFSISIAFGCGGFQNSGPGTQTGVSYDAKKQSIVLTARPGLWTTLPLIQGLGAAEIDTVEGFWIPRPWTSAQGCPPPMEYPAPATPTPPTAQTVGLAQIFTAGGSRVSRHAERPYIFTRKVSPGDNAALTSSYRLVLEGRITGFGKDSALRCWMEAPDHHPVCLFAVTLDRVAFEDEQGKQIANWTN